MVTEKFEAFAACKNAVAREAFVDEKFLTDEFTVLVVCKNAVVRDAFVALKLVTETFGDALDAKTPFMYTVLKLALNP